jgi:hypothetical protein
MSLDRSVGLTRPALMTERPSEWTIIVMRSDQAIGKEGP